MTDKLSTDPAGASLRPRHRPAELVLGLRGEARIGRTHWRFSHARLYADPPTHNYRVTVELVRGQRDELGTDRPLSVELVGAGRSAVEALGELVRELASSPVVQEASE